MLDAVDAEADRRVELVRRQRLAARVRVVDDALLETVGKTNVTSGSTMPTRSMPSSSRKA